MSCTSSFYDPDEGHKCNVSGDGCMFNFPNSRTCAIVYGEGPDVDKYEKERKFYIEESKRLEEISKEKK